MTDSNVASFLTAMAEQAPERAAVIVAGRGRRSYQSWTYRELERHSARCAAGLAAHGLEPGMRVSVLIRPGLTFVSVVFALLRMKAVPVLIDPGMGVGMLLGCIAEARPQALIGVARAHLLRRLRPAAFAGVRLAVTVGRRWPGCGPALEQLIAGAAERFEAIPAGPREMAAILFTSGGTGPPKGAVYEHGIFMAQLQAIRACYGVAPGEVELATFPLFALFCPGLGTTCVIPDMDASRPGRADPRRIVAAVHDHKATSAFGSPALWRRVVAHCQQRGVRMRSLQRVLVAGAPVPWGLVAAVRDLIGPAGEVYTPYGATEALPVCSIGGDELLDGCAERTRAGDGICVGRPVAGIDVRVIAIRDEPIAAWDEALITAPGVVGEITACGPVVTPAYWNRPQDTAAAKIDRGGTVVHRMGDLGYFDGEGRLWFCGRKAHRVTTAAGLMLSVCCEAIFLEHPEVARCALVGVGEPGSQRPVLVVECAGGRVPAGQRAGQLTGELLALGSAHEKTRAIRDILFHPGLPVDVRHNAKIDRLRLAKWAAGRLR